MPTRPARTVSIYIGVDPGIKGGLAWLGSEGQAFVVPIPRTEQGVWDWFTDLPQGNRVAAIENVWSMPNQGISSAFKFGRAYGFLRACLIGHDLDFYDVTSMTWQKSFGLQRPKRFSSGEWKKYLYQTARGWFPDIDIELEAADSLLIARHCKLVCEGKLPRPKPPRPKKKKKRRRNA